jgi:ABC-type multidrug transport system fused ATPase/permease subunit
MSILFKLGWFFRQQWHNYLVAFGALIGIAGLIMVPPWITGRIVDAVAQQRLTLSMLLSYLGLLLGVGIVIYLLRILWRRRLYGSSYRLGAQLRGRIYDHLTLMSPAFFQQHRTGDLMARATNDVTAVEMTAGEAVLASFDGVFTGVIVLIVMTTTLSWKLTLLALLPWPLMVYCMWLFGRQMHNAFAEAQRQFSLLNDKTQEAISGVRLIKAFGRQGQALAEYGVVTDDVSRANMAVAKVDARYDPVIFITVGTSFMLAVGGGAWWIHKGELSLGELTTFTMYLGYLIWPMFAYGWTLNLLERGSAAHGRIEELLQTAPQIADNGTLEQPDNIGLTIDIDAFRYPGSEQTVLQDIHCTIAAGTTFGIVGHTGSGKSTLINLLLRLQKNEQSRIRLGGRPLADYRLDALRRQFGLVPQDPFLFSVTIADNIALGRPAATLDDIRAAARLACIDDDIMAFPAQYDTLVGERGITLSGGQKQRIAIARALLLDPPILVLDDALSAVDTRTERRILSHLQQARRERSNIIVCHRLSAVVDADEIIVLRHGRVDERGRHRQLLAGAGWYAQMFHYQQIEASLDDE